MLLAISRKPHIPKVSSKHTVYLMQPTLCKLFMDFFFLNVILANTLEVSVFPCSLRSFKNMDRKYQVSNNCNYGIWLETMPFGKCNSVVIP